MTFLALLIFLAILTDVTLCSPDEAINKVNQTSPSYIVKFKTANLFNTTRFEVATFIDNHFTTFKRTQISMQAKYDITTHSDSLVHSEPKSVTSVNIGEGFNSVIGQFDPAFVEYLSQLNEVAYIEPNRVYKCSILPSSNEPKPYVYRHLIKADKKNKKHRKEENRRNLVKRNDLEKRSSFTQIDVPSWGISRINQRELGDLTTASFEEPSGAGIHVYVLDSGVHVNHPDFGDRAVHEKNFLNEGNIDYTGHGTHVAGIIAGSTYGVAKNAIIHNVKILDKFGEGTAETLLLAIAHVAETAPANRSIINLSLVGPRSSAIDDALSAVVLQHGIPVFVAAGNTGDDACNYSPPSNPYVFTVGASTNHDRVPLFSSYGPCVNLFAPGTNITSTWVDDNSFTMDGTSMAAPHVTGIAATLMSKYDFENPAELYNIISQLSTPDLLTSRKDADAMNLRLAYNGDKSSLEDNSLFSFFEDLIKFLGLK